MPKLGIDDLLVSAALDPVLCDRLRDAPESVFEEFDLTEEQRETLRKPDHRILRLLGEALTRQTTNVPVEPAGPVPQPILAQGWDLKDLALVLTLAPYAQIDGSRIRSISYATWISPLPEGSAPNTIPMPSGNTPPGEPLEPLHAVIQVSAAQVNDAGGRPHVILSASFRKASNVDAVPSSHPEPRSDRVAAVRSAAPAERYARILDLVHAMREDS